MTPKLPGPIARVTTKLGTHCSFNAPEIVKGDAIYTADQMREMWKQGMERAAEICETECVSVTAALEYQAIAVHCATTIRKEITP